MNSILVFCYGSNMLFSRIKARCASAKIIGVGHITAHSLQFHMHSTDGSGKADAYQTNNLDDVVWGTVIEINNSDKILLDGHEDLGSAYNEKQIEVTLQDGTKSKAWIYVACSHRIKPYLKPYCWYHCYVLSGAKENGLPQEYVQVIKAIVCEIDENDKRRTKNLI